MPDIAKILLLYPGKSLSRQLFGAAEQDPRWRLETSFEHSLPNMRQLLRRSNAALVDATGDPSLATEAFLQSISCLNRKTVAVYTEVAHDGLEVFVRSHGSLFFLGPLLDEEWIQYFDILLKS